MNYFFKRIALILILMMFAPPVFAFGKNKHKEIKPVEKQEVIHLDVSKNSENNEKEDWVQKDIIRDNVDTEFSIFDNLIDTNQETDHPFKIEEESLFGRIYKKKLERTTIPSFLLKDELTFKYKKGPVDKVQFTVLIRVIWDLILMVRIMTPTMDSGLWKPVLSGISKIRIPILNYNLILKTVKTEHTFKVL